MSKNIRKHMSLLGFKAKDKITGITGVVDSVCFDLYGCIQVSINQGAKTDGSMKECRWFDVSRIEKTSAKPVMECPNFDFGEVAEGKQGPADKAKFSK